jgi:uncharacterized protein (DUF924 family)
MNSEQRQNEILDFWFGRVEETIIPSENRARIWFGEDDEIDALIRDNFLDDLNNAITGKYSDWLSSARGQLALIIILDQFSRHIHRGTPDAYETDKQAMDICLAGLNLEYDHQLSLIERVFYYFPLLHSEDIEMQNKSVQAYQMLSDLSFAETRVIFESFFKFANHHFSVINRFGRFPQRNQSLKRVMTAHEQSYLKEIQE